MEKENWNENEKNKVEVKEKLNERMDGKEKEE